MDENPKATYRQSSRELAEAELIRFVHNPGLAELASLYGVNKLPEDRTEKIAVLQAIAAKNWDFRKGKERQEVDWDNHYLDQEGSLQRNTVFAATDKLGLVQNTEPKNKHPNTLAILGGDNHAPFDRLKYGLSIVEDFDQLVFLGSSRKLSGTARTNAADYAPNAKTEFELGCGAIDKLLSAKVIDDIIVESEGDSLGLRLYEFERNDEVKYGFALNTPYRVGSDRHRATTYDNYRFFVYRVELDKNPDHSVVAVTTGLYTAEQQIPAIQELTLPYGTSVETVGYSAEYVGNIIKPTQLLQEIKAAIDAAVRLNKVLIA
jgi:hypothetical protein